MTSAWFFSWDSGTWPRPSLKVLRWLSLALSLVLAGCKSALITRVTEYDANEAVSVLLARGIQAEKLAGAEQSFDVLVADSDMPRALEILVDAGLPRERRATLGDLFKREGLVSTASEERIRYAFGLSQELERTIATIDGISSARVHVAIPQSDPLATVRKPPSASIFVRYREPASPEALGPLVRGLVVRAIEGLDADRVSVAFTLAAPVNPNPTPLYTSVLGLRIAPDAAIWVIGLVIVPWLILAAVVALLTLPRLPAPLMRLRQELTSRISIASTSDGTPSNKSGAPRSATRQPVRRLEVPAQREARS